MKFNNITIGVLLLSIFFTGMISCEKDDSKMAYGFSKIYMPQAISLSAGVNNNYPVPSGTDSSTYNYYISSKDNKVNVILGTYLSGPAIEPYSVDISVDNDTVQQMFATQILDTTYMLMPAGMYSLPARLDVTGRSGTFDLAIDIAQLKSDTYKGKKLVLAVKIANPTKFELNPALSTTIVMVDVDALVIGPAINITSSYIKNPGNPFIAAAMQPGQSRWGTLTDWQANTAALSHGGYGGFGSDGDGKTIDLESGWGSPQILNGKLYQTITLPKGTYAFDPSGGSWIWQGTKDPCYVVVAVNADVLPDFANIVGNTAIMYERIVQPQKPITFELSTTTKVTVGVVVNYVKTEQGIKTKQVALYNYPKHL